MNTVYVEDVPGFLPALAAVRDAGGVLLGEEAARHLTILALAVATPHMRAEIMADLADELHELMPEVSTFLDSVSAQLREALR